MSGAFAVVASEDFHRPGEASWSVDEIRYDEIERDRIKEDTQLLYADRARTAGAACQVRAIKAYVTNQTRHAIILAGGDGTRLSEITRRD